MCGSLHHPPPALPTYLTTAITDVSMRAGQGQERRDFVKSTLGKSTCTSSASTTTLALVGCFSGLACKGRIHTQCLFQVSIVVVVACGRFPPVRHLSLPPLHPLIPPLPSSPPTGFASALGVLATLSPSLPANAGFLNKDKLPEVIKPADAEVDQDVLKSSEVQNELKAIRKYQEGVASLKADFTANPQADLYNRVRKVCLDLIVYYFVVEEEVFSSCVRRATLRMRSERPVGPLTFS